MTAADQIDQQQLAESLHTAVIGRHLRVFDSIDSTNRYARRLAEQQAPEGTVVLAEHQSAGRGRLERSWLAQPHTSILCSVVLYPALGPEYLFRLTMAASIAVVDCLRETAGVSAGIKWPNDIYVDGLKICGILTEVDCAHDSVRYAVVGMGLNVNSTFKGTELQEQAASLADITGREWPRQELLQGLLQHFDRAYARLGDAGLQEQWQLRCLHLGKRVRILDGPAVLEGIARGISDKGHLLLERSGAVEEIICGDVSLRWQEEHADK